MPGTLSFFRIGFLSEEGNVGVSRISNHENSTIVVLFNSIHMLDWVEEVTVTGDVSVPTLVAIPHSYS